METINGKVKVTNEYFLKMAKADYRNYREALWREIYQNSIDAGATEINVTKDAELRTITVEDNGCGMSLDTLVNKLLALGGSEKAAGATGAFGKAKELELFAHKAYYLHTHNLILEGSGDKYTIDETEDWFNGTKIVLIIQEDEDFGCLYHKAEDVAKKIETSCRIYVDGNPIDCAFPKGEFVKSLPVGDVYVNNNLPSTYQASVRMNGIWMFDHYVGSEMPHITLELSGSSIAAMTSNRDGLKDNSLRETNQFFNRLAADRKSALFPDKVEVKLRAKGTDGEMIEVEEMDLSFIENLPNVDRPVFHDLVARLFVEKAAGGLDLDLLKLRMAESDTSRYDYEELTYFGFRWDTIHKFEKGKEPQAREFLDGSQARARVAKTLLLMWGETIKQVMIDTHRKLRFHIGFTWDDNAQALYEADRDGGLCFYLNPNILAKYSLKNKTLLGKKLHLLACHEVAHSKYEYHDESFNGEFEKNLEASWGSDRAYKQIAKIK